MARYKGFHVSGPNCATKHDYYLPFITMVATMHDNSPTKQHIAG